MVPRIEAWAKFPDILKGFGDMGEILAVCVRGYNREQRIAFARQLLDACISEQQDKHAVAMLQLFERAVKDDLEKVETEDLVEMGQNLRRTLEQIYWGLPDLGRRARHCLVETKLHIVRSLISEWKAEELPESDYAFRRLIAMGWPVSKDYRQRNGESDVEMKARGRVVSDEERKGICEIVRVHMESFGSWEERKAGPDAVFGPWLAHAHVPEEIRNILVIARAKMGGSDLAVRDIRNAEVFRGLPDVALERLQDVVGPVRQMMADCEAIRVQLVAKVREGNPRWREDLAPLGWKVTFPSIEHVEVRVGPMNEPGQVMADIGAIIKGLQKSGARATWQLTIVVVEAVSVSKEPVKVTATWPMA